MSSRAPESCSHETTPQHGDSVGLAGYAIVFYMTPMPSISRLMGTLETWWRGEAVYVFFFRAGRLAVDELVRHTAAIQWGDRLPVLLAAGLHRCLGRGAGLAAAFTFRVTRGLTRLETAVFSTAVGLNLLSTWTLALGLAGQLGRLRACRRPGAADLCGRRRSIGTGADASASG